MYMILDIERIKKEYFRKVLAVSLSNRNYSTVVFRASFCLDDIKGIIEELKDEFHIDNVIFIDFDINRIKSFFNSQPTEKEIEKFIPKLSKPIGNMKVINFLNGRTNLSKNNSDYSKIYYSLLND